MPCPTYIKYITASEVREHLTILCPVAELPAVQEALHADGFHITSRGPRPVKPGKVDPTQILIVAYRTVPYAEV